jgi:hypothetical protein
VLEAAKIGADVMTAPPSRDQGLFKHVLTDKGIEGFLADWAKTGQAILDLRPDWAIVSLNSMRELGHPLVVQLLSLQGAMDPETSSG